MEATHINFNCLYNDVLQTVDGEELEVNVMADLIINRSPPGLSEIEELEDEGGVMEETDYPSSSGSTPSPNISSPSPWSSYN